MKAIELITESIAPLKSSDTGKQALFFMEEFRVNHLPLVDDGKFVGLISESDIVDTNNPDLSLGEHNLSVIKPYVLDDQHIYEVIKAVSEKELTVIPVVDSEENYKGLITLKCLISKLAELNSIKDPGGIIVLEIPFHDYSLSEISRIVESNDSFILSNYINTIEGSTYMEVTLKVSTSDIRRIIATFERFDYKIKSTFLAEEYLDEMKDRYDSFMKYLNV